MNAIGGESLMAECEHVLLTTTMSFLKMRWKHHLDRALLRELGTGKDKIVAEADSGAVVAKSQTTVQNKRSRIAKKLNF